MILVFLIFVLPSFQLVDPAEVMKEAELISGNRARNR
jgi:hypothetical protein